MMKIISTVLALTLSLTAQAIDPDRWQNISQTLFPNTEITEDANIITITTASRAEDAATVPVNIRTWFPQTQNHYVTDIWLIIDQNPSPVAAHFMLTPESGQADIETRVRINEYTLIRAIARVSDGHYYQNVRFIKASGGCSAPATRDNAEAGLGKIKITELNSLPGRPTWIQAQIRHPNDSGLAMDQLSHLYTPAHYVRHLTVKHADQQILTADLDISISENPEFEFYVRSELSSNLTVEFTDNTETTWKAQLKTSVLPYTL
jgi:sulfur-oxidizing protein SoxY